MLVLWRPKMEVVTYGCVTSVEAGGVAAGVKVDGLAGIQFEVVIYGCVTSVEAGGEAAF
jgi:hypothetical protein